MADLVIDYELLYNAANQLDAIEGDVDTINVAGLPDGYSPGSGGEIDGADLGPALIIGDILANFWWQWSSPLNNAHDQVKKLSATFRGVARVFFDGDATQLSGVNAATALQGARDYPAQYAQYQRDLDAWNKLPDPNHVPYLGADGQIHYKAVPRPQPPGQPDTTVTGHNGVTTTYTTGGTDPNDPNHGPAITSETTTYKDPVTGMRYTETTTFGPDKGWSHGGPVQDTVTTIQHDDGSTDVITTTMNTDGSASSTTVHTEKGGNQTTSTQTRPDWDSPWATKSDGSTGPQDGGTYYPPLPGF